MCYRYMMLGII